MKTPFLLLSLSCSLLAAEPPIPGRIVGNIISEFPGGFVIDYSSTKRLHRGHHVSIEWSDGQFFTKILHSSRGLITVSYYPTSISVELGATVKLLKK